MVVISQVFVSMCKHMEGHKNVITIILKTFIIPEGNSLPLSLHFSTFTHLTAKLT